MPRSPWSVAGEALMTVVLLLGPPLLATRLEWPLGEHTTWVWLAQYLRGGRVPDEAVIAFFLVVLWAVWAAHLVLVVLDVVSVLRGLAPRVGLVRVVWALVAGSTVATTTHTAAVAAHVDTVAEVPMAPVAAHAEEVAGAGGEQAEDPRVLDRTRVLIGFGFDSAALTPAMKESLELTIAMIADFGLPEAPVVVTGHTDPIGDPLYNQDLSDRRAQAVADYLAERVDEVAFEAQGVGSTQPPSATRASYEGHRRVEIAYTLQRSSAPASEPSAKAETEAEEGPEAAPAPERVRLDVATAGEGTGLDTVAVGTVAGVVGLGVGYAAGRRRTPTAPQKQSTDLESTTSPDDLDAAFTTEAPDPDRSVLLLEVPAGPVHDVIDEAGYVLVSDTARVSSRGGLAFAGAHALRVLATVVAEHVSGQVVLTSTAAALLEEEGTPIQGAQVTSDLRGAQIAVEAELLARARHLDADDDEPEEPTTAVPPLLVTLTTNDLDANQGLPALLVDTPGLATCVLGGTDHAKVTLDCENTSRTHVRASVGEATHTGPLRLWARPQGQDEQSGTSLYREASHTSESSSERKEPDQAEEGKPEEGQPEEEQLEAPGCPGEADARARVRVRLFAPQAVCELNGHDVLHGTRTSTYTLLAVLALGPREGVSHQEVTNVLAPQMPEAQARRFRSNAVTTLRRALRDALDLGHEVPIVENEKGRYRLQWEFFDIDVREFCGLYAGARTASTPEAEVKLRKMVSLYGDDLLSDLQDEWIAERRWELQAAVADVYMRLLDYVDDEEERILLIDCALRVDRLNEALYQEKMKHYALLGRKDAIHRCFHSLKEELQQTGDKPGPDSRALFESLVR